MAKSLLERITAKVTLDPTSGCWITNGPTNNCGYVQIQDKGKRMLVHRAVYEIVVGPIPGGLVLDHLCRHIRCCNPLHLEPVTTAENTRRGLAASANRTHCRAGLHELAASGITVDSDGVNRCKQCRRESRQRWAERNAA